MFGFANCEKSRYWMVISLIGLMLSLGGCAARFDAYVVSEESQQLTVFDFDANRLLQEVEGSPFTTGTGPSDVAYDSRHSRIYVTNSGENTLSAFRVKKVSEGLFVYREVLEPLDKINTEERPISVAVDTRHNVIYVLHQDGKLLVLDGKDLHPKYIYLADPYSHAAGIAYDARNDLIYVIDEEADALVILKGSAPYPFQAVAFTANYMKVVSTGSKPSAIAYDYRNDRVYVTNVEDNTLSVYEAGPFCKLIETIEVGFWPSDVAYDDRHNLIYVSKRAAHKVSVFDAEGFALVTQIDLPTAANPVAVATGLINGASPSLLYVANKASCNVSVFEIRDQDNFIPLPDSPMDVSEAPVSIATTQPTCPEILSLSPQEGHVGEIVTILGSGFGDEQGLSRVEFSAVIAPDIESWSESKIEVYVPPLAKSGAVGVIVGNHASAPPDGDLVKDFTVIPHAHIYVSAFAGNDHSGDGTPSNPYRSIKKALSIAIPSDVIHILYGSYTWNISGDTYPLVVKEGVRLVGDVPPGYEYPTMHDSLYPWETALVDMKEGSSIENVQIIGMPPPGIEYQAGAAISCAGNCIIRNCVIYGLTTGIFVTGDIQPDVYDNDIKWNLVGMRVLAGAMPRIRVNEIKENNWGILFFDAHPYIESNRIDKSEVVGIQKCDNETGHAFIKENRITNHNIDGEGYGISIVGSEPSYILNNSFQDNMNGIEVLRAVIRSNWFIGNQTGICTSGDGNCMAYNNELMGPTSLNGSVGMFLDSSHWLIDRNRVSGYSVGVAIKGGGPSLLNNGIQRNDWGIDVFEGASPFLGSLDKPGNNYIRDNRHVGLLHRSSGEINIQAVGNFWNPNIQGADNEGKYLHQTVHGPVPPEDGNNYSIEEEGAGIEF